MTVEAVRELAAEAVGAVSDAVEVSEVAEAADAGAADLAAGAEAPAATLVIPSASSAARNLRATGGSILEDEALTYSPSS